MQKYEADAPKRAARAAGRQRQREEERLERLEAETERMEQQESSGSSYHSETDFSRMPGMIHSTGGKTCRLYHNYGHSVEYVAADDPNDTVTITNVYSRTGSEITTNAVTFYL